MDKNSGSSSVLVVLASANSEGNTFQAVGDLFDGRQFAQADLNRLSIHPYRYGVEQKDEFLPLIERCLAADTIVFATPVYWYAMSGLLKTFFDRLTDLITLHKPTGRKLAGKRVFVLATGTGPALPEGFEVPFRLTAEFFDMTYGGAAYLHYKGNSLVSPYTGTFAEDVFQS